MGKATASLEHNRRRLTSRAVDPEIRLPLRKSHLPFIVTVQSFFDDVALEMRLVVVEGITRYRHTTPASEKL